jgi:hypothetical protein
MKALRFIPPALMLLALFPGPVSGVLAPFAPSAHAAEKSRKRLILKDGSYQVVTKYEVIGDRVRYMSAERGGWEEVPYELVDWPATDKWNKQHMPGNPGPVEQSPDQDQVNAAADQKEAAEIDREAAAAKADQQARTPLVAPGLNLPDEDGIFVLDYFQGIPELIHLDQSTGNVNRDASHNVLRAAISSFHGAQEPVRLDGQAARVRIHVNDPALYVSLDSDKSAQVAPESALVVKTPDANLSRDKDSYSSPESRYVIVRLEVHPRQRVIGAIRISRIGSIHQSEDIVPAKTEILPGKHWMKVTPQEPLDIGEYALMEILAPGMVNLDVWDFGISPNAPENKHPLTPIKTSQ